ncbi:MAG TPA: two-component regulator propeller domain-containing protein, partial [Marinilabiliaceae bacterium]|nr:two-component regulator propeller domain-containing protein [Marinilabiliaceae bacterium]
HSGLKLYNPESDNFTAYYHYPEVNNSLQPNVVDIFEDRQGNFYTLHKGDGVYVSFLKIGFQLFNISERFFWHTTRRNISAISEDDEGNLWLGSFNGGIDVFRWSERKIDRYSGEETSLGIGTVTFLFRDSKQNMWASTYLNGLKRFNPATETFQTWEHSPNSNSVSYNDIRSMAEDSLGNFWLATHGGGVDYFEVESNRFTNFNLSKNQLSSDWVNDVMVDTKNRLWAATSYGISMKAAEDSVFRTFIPDVSKNEGLKGDDAICLLQDNLGTIWAGTNQGLYFYVEADTTFSLYESFPINFITSLEVDQNDELWIGTHEGLLKLNPATGRVYHFDEYDGLQGIDFNPRSSFFNGVNNLYFGGPGGVNLFDPNKLAFNDVPPTLRFSRFLLFNTPIEEYGDGKLLSKELNSIKEIVLEYKQNFFTIEFVAFNYTNPLKNRYACKLEGFDEDWVDRGNQRSMSYTNLFPGKYIFRVKAANNHGVWNEEGIYLVIRVLPPWWLSVWFFLSLVGLIILAWFLVYRFRTRSLRIQGLRLAQLVSEQTSQLRENNEELLRLIATRDKLFSIIAHDLRSPFNTILGFTGLLTEAFDETDPERMKQYARYIHDSSISVFNLLENLLFWARSQTNQIQFNPSASQLDEIVEDSVSLVRESAVKKNQTIDTSQYINYEVFMDVDMMRSVVRNLIINAIKFTLPGGFIKIASSLTEEFVTVSISDTGQGMSQKDIKRVSRNLSIHSSPGTSGEKGAGLGLSLSYEFIKMNGGELTIESTLGKGSTFSFTLPRRSKP